MRRNYFSAIFNIILALLIFSALASAQTTSSAPTTASDKTTQAAPQSPNQTSANENFDLNIAERRITESGFAASTSVEAGEETTHGLLLRVGVGLSAGEIDVLLRNVRGHVRFHASLDRVLERLNARHTTNAVP